MKGIEFLKHACFKITNGVVVYTDPFQLDPGLEKADLVLITHEHYDHFSPEDIAKILKPDTVLVATPGCKHDFANETLFVRPGDEVEAAGVRIRAVAAYNTDKAFHPRSAEHVGYVFGVGGVTYYLAGDTDVIPEMGELGPIDMALVPVSGTYVMNADEAARAVNEVIKPGAAVPMHYGTSVVGSRDDAERFAALCRVETRILL